MGVSGDSPKIHNNPETLLKNFWLAARSGADPSNDMQYGLSESLRGGKAAGL